MSSCSPIRLELDVGNTRIKWRLQELDSTVGQGVDLKSDISLGAETSGLFDRVAEVWVSSVHQIQNEWIESRFPNVQYATTQKFEAGLVNSYTDASRMGVDRWLAMLAALAANPEKAHIVIDAGTAITLDIIDTKGVHVGGYICPGLNMMKQALLGGTNKVLAISDWEVGREPGKATQTCVDHGIQDMVLSWIERNLDLMPNACVTISGGDGEKLSKLLGRQKSYRPDLVLDGLNLSFRNK